MGPVPSKTSIGPVIPLCASCTEKIALRQASAAAKAFQFESASARPWRVAVLPPSPAVVPRAQIVCGPPTLAVVAAPFLLVLAALTVAAGKMQTGAELDTVALVLLGALIALMLGR